MTVRSINLIPSNEQWAGDISAHLPARWKKRLLSRWADVRTGNTLAANRAANIELRETVERLESVRLPLDASDGDIVQAAERLALECLDVARIQHQAEAVRDEMERFVREHNIEPPSKDVTFQGAMRRMSCPDWWRRKLRAMHAKHVEGAAIGLGYVNRARDCYVSNESLSRRREQIRRNAATLEQTVMRNELEQEFTLAELASKGTANKAIRRGELMTRIAGFERIAVERGDGGLFITMTCPSRMHKWNHSGKGRQVYENPKYDGTNPKDAQAHLSGVYARIRAKLARDKVGIYGFRIAEPHHDGCPHWHLLVFHERGQEAQIAAIFRKYALSDSPDEPGAALHRVKVEAIDWSKGTAAGYIAKYVAKNIDGAHVGEDLFGNPAMESSARVEAWAATWGIRQFQQVGGPPVGVWRELRRVQEVPEGAPEHLHQAHAAANKIEQGEEVKPAAWDEYVRSQGGAFCGRKYLIRIAVDESEELGRYGEPIGARPIGVETEGQETYRDGIVPNRVRFVVWLVQSVRHVWEVVKRGVKGLGPVFSAPWTGVNNCTREGRDYAYRNREREGRKPDRAVPLWSFVENERG